jgi:hypothetical protein
MLGLGNAPDALFIFKDITRTDINAADFHRYTRFTGGKSMARPILAKARAVGGGL